MAAMAEVRRYRAEDLDDLYRVCLETGDAGKDATALHDDPALLGHVYVGAYATVCYKAGNRVDTVTVGSDGMLTSELLNRHGKAMDISYYIVTDRYCPPTGT